MSKPATKRARRLRMVVTLLAISLVAMVIASQFILGPIVQQKLQETIAAHLDASLTFESLVYRPPFTVHLYGVRFLAHPDHGGTELLTAKRIDLSLAKLPVDKGPLIIERFAIDGLMLHIIRQPDGTFAGLDLGRPAKTPTSPAAMKLSDVLRLRHFSLKNGTVLYQDQPGTQAAPTQWQGINSEMALTPRSKSLYGFRLDASDGPVAQASVDGTIDVDSLLLQIVQLTASVQAPGNQSASGPDPLPTVLRTLVQRYAVQGKVTVTTAATIPLKTPEQSFFTADIGVADGGATLPEHGEKLNNLSFSTHIERQAWAAAGQKVKVELLHFRAVSGGAILQIAGAIGLLDPQTRNWSVSGMFGSLDAPLMNHGPWGLTGHVDFHADVSHDAQSNQTPFVGAVNLIGINVHPPGLAAALGHLTGAIHFAGSDAKHRQVDLQSFVAYYGGDRLTLDHATVSLDQLPDRVLISDIASHLDLVQDAPQCPGDLGDVLENFKPSGLFTVTGAAAMQHVIRDDGPGYSPEWELNISTENGSVALLDERLLVTALNGQMLATKHAISIPDLTGTLLGGAMDLSGSARVVEPIVYQGEFSDRGASVTQFANVFHLTSNEGKIPSGEANLRFKFFSQPPAASTQPVAAIAVATTQPDEVDEWLSLLGGDGSLQIDNGNLWALPALQGLSKHTKVAREALTAGEAAAVFSVGNRTVYLKHVAVYSPALGLQGSGTESFDGLMNLDIIAAPLGDWRRKLADADIPFFSRVFSSAAGTLEKFVGNATSELLYHFRITGSRENPVVKTVPAPFLTDNAATLFAKMLRHDGNTKLVDAVNEK